DPRDRRERLLQADQVARAGGAERGACHQPLEILDALQRVAELAAIGGAESQLLDGVQPIADRVERQERANQPGAEQAAAGPSDRAVDLVEQRAGAAALGSLENFQMLQRRRSDQEPGGAVPE